MGLLLNIIFMASYALAATPEKWDRVFNLPPESEAEALFMSKIDALAAGGHCADLSMTSLPGQVNVMVRYPKVFSKGIDKLHEKRPDCLGLVTTNYRSLLPQLSPENKPELTEYCETHKEETLCEKVKNNLGLIDQNIRKLVALQRGSNDWPDQNSCNDTPFKDFEDLAARVREYEEQLSCRPLKENEEKIVLGHNGKKLYQLKKSGPNSFEASFIMNVAGPSVEGVTPHDMLKRVQSCLKKVGPYLSPPGLPAIQVKALSPSEAGNTDIPEHSIKIASKNQKSANGGQVDYSDAYRSNIECGTIVHEVLHLLGLPDEYPHAGTGNCQVFPTLASIMGGRETEERSGKFKDNVPQVLTCECKDDVCQKVFNSEDDDLKLFYALPGPITLQEGKSKFTCKTVESRSEPWEKLSDKKNLSKLKILKDAPDEFYYQRKSLTFKNEVKTLVYQCSCPPESADCKKDLVTRVKLFKKGYANNQSPQNCPPDSNTLGKEIFEGEKPQDGISVHGNTYKIYTTPTQNTGLLIPAHVSLITNGHCPTKAQKYQECIAWGSYNDGDEKSDVPEHIRAANPGSCLKSTDPKCVKIRCDNRPAYCFKDESYNSMK